MNEQTRRICKAIPGETASRADKVITELRGEGYTEHQIDQAIQAVEQRDDIKSAWYIAKIVRNNQTQQKNTPGGAYTPTWQVVTHWTDDHHRPWADIQNFDNEQAAHQAYTKAKANNKDVPDLNVDLMYRDNQNFPRQLASWTTTKPEPFPQTPLGEMIKRLAETKKI